MHYICRAEIHLHFCNLIIKVTPYKNSGEDRDGEDQNIPEKP